MAAKFKSKKIETRQLDYSNKDSCRKAFEGIEKLFFISSLPGQSVSRQDQHKNVIEAAIDAKVKHLYYTTDSVCGIQTYKCCPKSGVHFTLGGISVLIIKLTYGII